MRVALNTRLRLLYRGFFPQPNIATNRELPSDPPLLWAFISVLGGDFASKCPARQPSMSPRSARAGGQLDLDRR
jgi:hypothetical protein